MSPGTSPTGTRANSSLCGVWTSTQAPFCRGTRRLTGARVRGSRHTGTGAWNSARRAVRAEVPGSFSAAKPWAHDLGPTADFDGTGDHRGPTPAEKPRNSGRARGMDGPMAWRTLAQWAHGPNGAEWSNTGAWAHARCGPRARSAAPLLSRQRAGWIWAGSTPDQQIGLITPASSSLKRRDLARSDRTARAQTGQAHPGP